VAQNVKIPIITTHFEEHGIWTIPLIDDLFDEVAVVVDPEPDRAFVSSAAGVRFDPHRHTPPLSG